MTTKNNDSTNTPRNNRPEDSDKWHIGLLMGMLVLTYFINYSFGFKHGTFENGMIVLFGILTWLVIAVLDYFRFKQ